LIEILSIKYLDEIVGINRKLRKKYLKINKCLFIIYDSEFNKIDDFFQSYHSLVVINVLHRLQTVHVWQVRGLFLGSQWVNLVQWIMHLLIMMDWHVLFFLFLFHYRLLLLHLVCFSLLCSFLGIVRRWNLQNLFNQEAVVFHILWLTIRVISQSLEDTVQYFRVDLDIRYIWLLSPLLEIKVEFFAQALQVSCKTVEFMTFVWLSIRRKLIQRLFRVKAAV
jgi:hypothetical protein